MLVEIEGHTGPNFKAPVYAKMELWGPECGCTFSIQTSLLNISLVIYYIKQGLSDWFLAPLYLSTNMAKCVTFQCQRIDSSVWKVWDFMKLKKLAEL